MARSTHYARQAAASASARQRPSRPPEVADSELVSQTRDILGESESLGFRGEGYRKVWARLRQHGVPTAKQRTRRLMRQYGLQAPHRIGNDQGPRSHDGCIIPRALNAMWGTDDATQVTTRLDGTATVFVAVDHSVGDPVGVHAAARPETRYEALEPIHQCVQAHFGDLAEHVADGLMQRHDNGSQYVSDVFQKELRFLGIESSPSFVSTPEGNGVAERFIRTLKEQLLWVEHFDTVESLRQALLAFKQQYNRH